MSRLSNLLRQVQTYDPRLAADLRKEVDALSARRAFGLNFERHIPETVELPGRPVRRGDKVRFLPKRGERPGGVDRRLWRVDRIHRSDGRRVAALVRRQDPQVDPETANRAVDDLVVVAEFRDPIYPGLVSTGTIERGGERPFHAVINAENFHALQVLLYTHEGSIDLIYIDPPYNSGARDWKYNNDYVDSDDAYRHSKWLAMMERRLKLAKRLLDPESSVLIVTVDEKEYLRLGLLLQQTFEASSHIQMVSITISPRGTNRKSEFARVDEYAFFVFFGAASIQTTTRPDGEDEEVRWQYLRRGQKTLIRGVRTCILVTNNEVSADEQAELRASGLRPGDEAWEARGICELVTKARIAAAVTGRTPDGSPIEGDYKFTDEFPMADGFEENVEFFTMTYEAPRPVAHNRAFEAIAPLLWLRAGSQGRRIEQVTDDFDVADTYAVLFDLDASQGFLAAVARTESVRMAFIVTDDDHGFQMACRDLPQRVRTVRLYESYLTNFTLDTGRE